MSNYALALCGGGAKGAFQIGMWKALLDFRYIKKFPIWNCVLSEKKEICGK